MSRAEVAEADTAGAILDRGAVVLVVGRLRRPVDTQDRAASGRAVVAGALPLRVEAGDGAGAARNREPSPPGPPGCDVLARRAAVASVRAGVRLPGGRPRVGIRPCPAGDDCRRLVDTRHRRGCASNPGRLVRVADRSRHGSRGDVRRVSARLLPPRWPPSSAMRSSGPSRCCCSASIASRCPFARACDGLAS